MLEFVFNGMVFLLLGLQLPGILETSLMAAEIDPNVEIWMLFTDIILIYAALMLVRFGWLWTMKKFSNRFLKKKPMEFGSWTTREILIASFAGVRGAITLAGVLSIPLLLPDGNVFPARYELVFTAAGVILFSLFVGVVMLPILLQHIEVADHSQQLKEERIARAATAEVAIVAIQKMEERLAADTEENIDNQLLTEVSSRVVVTCVVAPMDVTTLKVPCRKRTLSVASVWRHCVLNVLNCTTCAPRGRSATKRCKNYCTISICLKRC